MTETLRGIKRCKGIKKVRKKNRERKERKRESEGERTADERVIERQCDMTVVKS